MWVVNGVFGKLLASAIDVVVLRCVCDHANDDANAHVLTKTRLQYSRAAPVGLGTMVCSAGRIIVHTVSHAPLQEKKSHTKAIDRISIPCNIKSTALHVHALTPMPLAEHARLRGSHCCEDSVSWKCRERSE